MLGLARALLLNLDDLLIRFAPTVPAIVVLRRIVDHGPGTFYRYHISGENLNFPEEHPDREFLWSVPNIDDPRYDMSRATWDKPTGRLRDLPIGARFRCVGYPHKFLVYVAQGDGWYDENAPVGNHERT